MKKLLKFFSYFLLGLIILLLLFGMFTQTPIFKNWLKNRVIALVEEQTDFDMTAAKLHGNLLQYIQLQDVQVEFKGHSLLKADAVLLHYAPAALLSRRIVMRQIVLDSPEVDLREDENGVWNITELAGSDTLDSGEPSFLDRWQIQAPHIEVKSGKVHIFPVDDHAWRLPKEIRELNLTLGFGAFRDQFKLHLTGLSFETAEPDLALRGRVSNAEVEPGNLLVEKLAILSDASKVESRVSIKDFDNPDVDLTIAGQPLSFADVSRFFPDVALAQDLQFTIEAKGKLADLRLNCQLRLGESELQLAGTVAGKDQPLRYDLAGRVTRLNLAQILQDSTQKSDLNFRFKVTATGLQWRDISGVAVVELDASAYSGYRLPPANLTVRAKRDTIDYDLAFEVEKAYADLTGRVIVTPKRLEYGLAGKISHLNLNPYFPEENLDTDLNLTLKLRGRQAGSDLNSLTADLRMIGHPSRAGHIVLDSSRVHIKLQEQNVSFEEFVINSPSGALSADGNIAFSGESDMNIMAELTDLSILSPYVALDSLFGAGKFAAWLQGDLDSLTFQTDFELSQSGYAGGTIALLSGVASGAMLGSDLTFDADGRASELAVFDVAVDTMTFEIGGADSIYTFDLFARGYNDVSVEAGGKMITWPGEQELLLEKLDVGTAVERWKNPQTARVRLLESGVEISELALTSDGQTVIVTGGFDLEGTNSLRLQAEEFRLGRFMRQFDKSIELTGRLNFSADLNGTLSEPVLSASGAISELQYLQIPKSEVTLNAGYSDNSFSWQADLSTSAIPKLLESSGELPGKLSLSPFILAIEREKPLVFKFNSRGIDVSVFDPFVKGIRDVRGLLTADILISNTLEDLSGKGTIRVIDGEFVIPELGTTYRNFSLALDLDGRSVKITDLRMRSGSGTMNFVEGALSLSRDRPGVFKSVFRLRNFEVMNNKKMRARASGEVELAGSIQSPRFSGDLTIDEASINYEKWLEDETAVLLTSQPFFMMTADTVGFDSTGAIRFQKQVTKEGLFTESDFYKALRGQLSVEFLRNSWIRSRDTNIEINGEITVVKESPEFVLQGNVSTARGFYTLLGNRFQVERGNIFFDGDPDLNAEVDIVAIYRFVDQTAADPKPHAFKVLITGKLYEPEFQFTLDDVAATQEDIISILLFGQKSSNSEYASGEALNDNNNDQLSQAARGILTTQTLNMLSQRLGEEFRLDVIQLESGKDWKDSRVRIGKYLTPEVFVSLSQPFGSQGNQKVELEYAIPAKILFFHLLLQAVVEEQGDSGADVIWKIEW